MSGHEDTRQMLANRLDALIQVGLEVHEEFERDGVQVVSDLCRMLELDPTTVPISAMATLVFSYALFGQPLLCASQQRLQETVIDRLEASERMLFRSLQNQDLRAWSYQERKGGRSTGRPLGGVDVASEEFIDGVLHVTSRVPFGQGEYLAWFLTEGQHKFLVCAWVLDDASRALIVGHRPFPLTTPPQQYWEDHIEFVLRVAIAPVRWVRDTYAFQKKPPSPQPRASQRMRPSSRLLPSDLVTEVYLECDRRGQLRPLLANGANLDQTEELTSLLEKHRWDALSWVGKGAFTGANDPQLEAFVPLERIANCFGVSLTDGGRGEDRGLRSLPIRVLGIAPEHILFDEVHAMEPISRALAWESKQTAGTKDVSEAFVCFRREQRWLATYSRVELGRDEHVERLDYATLRRGLSTLFEPRLATLPIESMELSKQQLSRLETALRKKPYDETKPVTVGDLPDDREHLVAHHNVGERAELELKRGLLTLAQRWRNTLFGVETRQAPVSETTTDLEDGLSELASLFDFEGV
ncbi:MAG: hypothetical protein AUK47_00295 [Deltaproteobacteria bacterium CG2_30_63_29]|nr:MAG: hypothetical protein AUK47_00295 [Deltaproteobacteria bacterium CG2_30_63_29]PJB42863.1 MAG: hypothetical protein CO108_11075 [Deltaproteobacteria bacterium CG_4_9_14_3_um_filter_63_12]